MTKLRVSDDLRSRRLAVPPMPGPFVNTKLLPIGVDRRGVERFWISTFNPTSGSLGMLCDEGGGARAYTFAKGHAGFYGAAAEDAGTLWLCGDLSQVVRLKLASGAFQAFATGMAPALSFAGMALDVSTRRLFAAARQVDGPTGFTFDLRTRQVVAHRNQWESSYTYNRFPNGDGTWTMVGYFPGQLLRWDPRVPAAAVSKVSIADVPLEMLHQLVHDERLGWYLPTLGWYDAKRDRLRRGGPRPAREMQWFSRDGGRVLGCEKRGADLQLGAWDLATGRVESLASIADTPVQNVAASRRGDVVAMSTDGVFRVLSKDDLGLKLSRRTPAARVGTVNALRLIDGRRIVGTTFITQRFWVGDLSSGRSRDCGRAAPGTGQITRIHRIGRRIYMAAYTGGELVEFDADRPAAFPVNPRVVAQHAKAMRPVASAAHGPVLWYACSRHYGIHGSILFRYDTGSGEAKWVLDPFGPRQIFSMVFDAAAGELICGSTIHSDQGVGKPKVKQGMLGRIGGDDLSVRAMEPARGLRVDVAGWLRRGVMLCLDCTDDAVVARAVSSRTLEDMPLNLPAAVRGRNLLVQCQAMYAGSVGRFILKMDDRLELHDLRRRESLVCVLATGVSDERWFVDGASVLIAGDRAVWVLDDALAGRSKKQTGHLR